MTDLQEVIEYYFETKGERTPFKMNLRPGKDLLELCGSLKKAKYQIRKADEWFSKKGLNYNINTIIKKYIEING